MIENRQEIDMKGYRDDRIRELEALYPFWQEKTIWGFFEETAERFPDQDFIVRWQKGWQL